MPPIGAILIIVLALGLVFTLYGLEVRRWLDTHQKGDGDQHHDRPEKPQD